MVDAAFLAAMPDGALLVNAARGVIVAGGLHPVIDTVLPLDDAAEGFRRMLEGDVFGKIVFRH